MKRQAESSFRKTWDILFPFLIYFVVHDLAQVLLAFLMDLSLTAFGAEYAAYMTAHAETVNGLLNAGALLLGMASVWPMAHNELRWARERAAAGRADEGGSLRISVFWLVAALFAVSLALGTNLLLSLTGVTGSSQTYDGVAVRQYGVAFGAGLMIYGILSPLAEEIVFRGLIYNRMKRYFPTGLSVVVCGLLFGVYHGNLVQGIYGCILGIAITFSYELYGSFAIPVLFHALANVSVFMAGYDQNWFYSIITVPNCVILLLISFGSLTAMCKLKKSSR